MKEICVSELVARTWWFTQGSHPTWVQDRKESKFPAAKDLLRPRVGFGGHCNDLGRWVTGGS